MNLFREQLILRRSFEVRDSSLKVRSRRKVGEGVWTRQGTHEWASRKMCRARKLMKQVDFVTARGRRLGREVAK